MKTRPVAGSSVCSAIPCSRSATIANAMSVRAATPRNTQRQWRYSATAPARNGPMSEGTTHAAEKAANTRPWICTG